MSHPFIVEFTGPPGVGKSSLYKAVTRRGGLSFFRPSSTLQGWLYGRSLRHQLARLAVHEPSFSATHEKLLKRKLEALESTATTLYRRCWMLSNAVQKLLADVRMLSDHSGNRYLIEEGLCHGFSAALNDDEGITLMSRHRGFVFIEPDELGTVVRRLQMRGGRLPIHEGLDETALRQMTADMLEHNRDLMSRLESAGAPVPRLRAEAPVERNAHTTRDFLRGLA